MTAECGVRRGGVPLGLALGLIASLSRTRLEELATARDLQAALREPLEQLLDRRRGVAPASGARDER